jgi:hypothetical protein
MSGVPGLPSETPSNSKVESHPMIIAGKSICSRTVCAFVIASAMTISAGCIALKKSVSSSTLLTIIFGDKPADSSKRRRLVD